MYNKSIAEIFSELDTSKDGLTSSVVSKRQATYGKNVLTETKKITKWQRFFSQFRDVLILILLATGVLSIFIAIFTNELEELVDAGMIFFVVMVNAVIGFVQENKAEADMQALKNMTKPYAKVIRNGKLSKIATENIVVGDVVLLEAGDIVPADMRLFDIASLKIEESAITGESVPVEKTDNVIEETNLPIADRYNMAYSGTVVVYGRGYGVVTAIGDRTEMGKIAGVLGKETNERTNLQKRIDKTSKVISISVLSISAIIFLLYTFVYKHDFVNSFMVAISIAVSAIPEGLPAGITITMALGVNRMSKNKAIVRKLSAVETLGNTQVICSDKTGTLTLNKMTVKDYFIFGKSKGNDNKGYLSLINGMLLCNDSVVKNESETSFGDPTEVALVNFAQEHGYYKETLEKMCPRVNEIPFDSNRKLMTTINKFDDDYFAFTKGAIDSILSRCTKILDNGKMRDITQKDIDTINDINKSFCSRALRVLAFSIKEIVGDPLDVEISATEHNMVFVGLVGMIDPPRDEVKSSILECKRAGIIVSMITGDHKDTALAIAKDLNIAKEESQVITGAELAQMTDEELNRRIFEWNVFARVSPEHKVRIVKAYQSHDLVCAMTGDGVNDAPSLKTANIGIGMGIAGTDVTKEVADIILTDDNFATIVTAVKEGRTIYQNIMNLMQYLLQTCLCELILLSIIVGILGRELFTPALLIWNNFVSDSFPALALGLEKPHKDIMRQKPNSSKRNLFSGVVGLNIIVGSIMQAILIGLVYIIGLHYFGYSNTEVVTMCFLALAFVEIFHAFNMRSTKESLFSIGIFTNKYMWGAGIISCVLAVILIIVPIAPLQNALGITTINGIEWLITIAISFAIIPLFEIHKLIVRRYEEKRSKKTIIKMPKTKK